jgi:hypothetical protein
LTGEFAALESRISAEAEAIAATLDGLGVPAECGLDAVRTTCGGESWEDFLLEAVLNGEAERIRKIEPLLEARWRIKSGAEPPDAQAMLDVKRIQAQRELWDFVRVWPDASHEEKMKRLRKLKPKDRAMLEAILAPDWQPGV